MTRQSPNPVVVGVDGSSPSVAAARWAAGRAARDGLPLRIVHAYELPIGFPAGVTQEESILDALRVRGGRWLSQAQDAAAEVAPAVPVEVALVAGDTVAALLRESGDAALVVLGNRGRGALTGLLVGNTAQTVVGAAESPVVLLRGGADVAADTAAGAVVVGVDGTESSAAAVEFAFGEAAAAGAPLVAVHAWSESVFELALAGDDAPLDLVRHRDAAGEALAERLAGWQEKYPEVPVECVLVHDRPGRALRGFTRTARLVVVGRRGRGGFPGLRIGSTSNHLVHHATCPVAVVGGGLAE